MAAQDGVERTAAALAGGGAQLVHDGRRIGLEKESLRIGPRGMLAKTPHPRALGSALTHPFITTDFSEAMLEFVTPPLSGAGDAAAFLEECHAQVYARIGDELLWPASMPCIVKDETEIPLARYGSSNLGRMKTIYRRGLGYRYGRTMQVIAGVHFNYSVGGDCWRALAELAGAAGAAGAAAAFRSERYMGLIRNFLRLAWMIPYLFGVSPAICRSFLGSSAHPRLEAFDETTLYGRHATSLRMGDIGYQNNQEASIGIRADYNSLAGYVASLARAVTTEHAAYRRLGVKVGGEYRQINACILQIENEYYSTMRPKRAAGKEEMPLAALRRGGVEYVELRSLDVDVFMPAGVGEAQLKFIEMLAFYCLLAHSPPIGDDERRAIDHNEIAAAHDGRAPGLKLNRNGRAQTLADWGLEICDRLWPVCELFDGGYEGASGGGGGNNGGSGGGDGGKDGSDGGSVGNNGNGRRGGGGNGSSSGGDSGRGGSYADALREQSARFRQPDLCPSARMLDAMSDGGWSFVGFAEAQAARFRNYFAARAPQAAQRAAFNRAAEASHERQAEMETGDDRPLERYINDYFAQLAPADNGDTRPGAGDERRLAAGAGEKR